MGIALPRRVSLNCKFNHTIKNLEALNRERQLRLWRSVAILSRLHNNYVGLSLSRSLDLRDTITRRGPLVTPIVRGWTRKYLKEAVASSLGLECGQYVFLCAGGYLDMFYACKYRLHRRKKFEKSVKFWPSKQTLACHPPHHICPASPLQI